MAPVKNNSCFAKHAKWFLPIFVTVLGLSMGGTYAISNAASNQAKDIASVSAAQASGIASATAAQIEKLEITVARQTAEIAALRATLEAMRDQVGRIERKLDQ